MKKFVFLMALCFGVAYLYAQTQGITYQALIISDKAEQIPGKDISGNILPNHDIMMRFTILDAAGTIDYQETQATTTDAFGMINLIIGKGELTNVSPKTFTEIDWSGEPKSLKVDISFDQVDPFFTDFSLQELNFVPYAYHKNITATGSLKVDGVSSLQDLAVHATTNLNGRVDVNNSSPVHMTGNLHVEDTTVLDDRLYVNSKANFTGQVTIDADINGDQDNSNSFPLVIRGSTQGISIKVDGSKSNANDYLLFYDDGGVQGVIEGENAEDVYTDLGYYIDNAGYLAGIGKATLDVVGASTSATVCVGIVPCVTTPTPSLIISAAAKLVIAIAQMAAYNYSRFANAGVVYKTKGADYAEWLPKLNSSDIFYPGDIVGIKGGYVTFKTDDADVIMVVSSNPIVLGNTPEKGVEDNFVKVAFIGQVPVKVLGVVNAGDYILANGKNDGGGIAVSPSQLSIDQIKYIVGMAWPNSTKIPLGYANTAVGLNVSYVASFDVSQEQKITEQQNTINQLQDQLNTMNDVLEQVLPEYAGKMENQKSSQPQASHQNNSSNGNVPVLAKSGQTIIYADITTDQIRQAITLAKQMLREQNFDVDNDPSFQRLDADPDYLNSFVNKLQGSVQKYIDEDYNRNMKAGINVVKMSNN